MGRGKDIQQNTKGLFALYQQLLVEGVREDTAIELVEKIDRITLSKNILQNEEIKSFLNPSPINDLHRAIGQYVIYKTVLAEEEPSRRLYLGIPLPIHDSLFLEPIGKLILERNDIHFVVFNASTGSIVKWSPEPK